MMGILERGHQLVCSLRGHDAVLHFERNRLSLRCLNCALQTPGWSLGPEDAHTATHDLRHGHGPYWRFHKVVEGALHAATRHHFPSSLLHAAVRR
jgi:hypothetical protein